MSEVWKVVPSFPEFEASNEGRVRRCSTYAHPNAGGILSGCEHNSGYHYLQVRISKRRKVSIPVHRMVCEAFHGPAPEGRNQVRHLDGTRKNNRARNLAWGSNLENARDRRIHATNREGVNHWKAKLDEHDVLAIFCLRRRGLTGDEIGPLFGVDAATINRIIRRDIWARVDVPKSLLKGAHQRQHGYSGKPVPRPHARPAGASISAQSSPCAHDLFGEAP